MQLKKIFDPRKTTKLFDLSEKFNFFKDLILRNKLPKVILLTGNKGVGKLTLVFHLMNFYFDKENYDLDNNKIIKKNNFFINLSEDLFSNIIYLNGSDFKNIKIDDIRDLRSQLLKTSINNDKRFIILDDVEMFNINSLNGLLRIIEEPNKNNYFILINNKKKTLIDTIKSRCNEFQILLNQKKRNNIINQLMNYFNQQKNIRDDLVNVSPGNFLYLNYFFLNNKIDFENEFIKNLEFLINLYKKDKDILYKDILIFFTEYHLQILRTKKMYDQKQFIYIRNNIIKKINEFFIYNLNMDTFIKSIETKFE